MAAELPHNPQGAGAKPKREGTPSRTKARRRALDMLFESEQREVPTAEILALHRANSDRPVNPYTVEILNGVDAHREEIDEYLATYAQGWTLERMPSVDRNVLRIGVWELLYNDDTPDKVALSEAVAMVRELSTDESPTFVNGLLGRIEKLKPTLLG